MTLQAAETTPLKERGTGSLVLQGAHGDGVSVLNCYNLFYVRGYLAEPERRPADSRNQNRGEKGDRGDRGGVAVVSSQTGCDQFVLALSSLTLALAQSILSVLLWRFIVASYSSYRTMWSFASDLSRRIQELENEIRICIKVLLPHMFVTVALCIGSRTTFSTCFFRVQCTSQPTRGRFCVLCCLLSLMWVPHQEAASRREQQREYWYKYSFFSCVNCTEWTQVHVRRLEQAMDDLDEEFR